MVEWNECYLLVLEMCLYWGVSTLTVYECCIVLGTHKSFVIHHEPFYIPVVPNNAVFLLALGYIGYCLIYSCDTAVIEIYVLDLVVLNIECCIPINIKEFIGTYIRGM